MFAIQIPTVRSSKVRNSDPAMQVQKLISNENSTFSVIDNIRGWDSTSLQRFNLCESHYYHVKIKFYNLALITAKPAGSEWESRAPKYYTRGQIQGAEFDYRVNMDN